MPDAAYYTVNISVDELEKGQPFDQVLLGKQGENGVRRIVIDCSAWGAIISNPSYSITARRAGESESYLANGVTSSGTTVTWVLSDEDTAIGGYGEAEIRASSGTDVKKSAKFRTLVKAGVENPSGNPPVTPPYWANTLIDVAEQAQEVVDEFPAVQSAAQTASAAVEDVLDAMPKALGTTWTQQTIAKNGTAWDITSNSTRCLSGLLDVTEGDTYTATDGVKFRLAFEKNGAAEALQGSWVDSYTITAQDASRYDKCYINVRQGGGSAEITPETAAATIHATGSNTVIVDVASVADVGELSTRMTAAENNIAGLGGRMTAAEGDITTMDGRLDAVEAKVPGKRVNGVTMERKTIATVNGAYVIQDSTSNLLTEVIQIAANDTWTTPDPFQFKFATYTSASGSPTNVSGWMQTKTFTAANLESYQYVRFIFRRIDQFKGELKPEDLMLYTTDETYLTEDTAVSQYEYDHLATRLQDYGDPFNLNEPRAGLDDVMTSYALSFWPQAVSFTGVYDRLYFGFTTHDGSSGVGSYDYTTRETKKTVLKRSEPDDHNMCAVHVFPDGYILAVYTGGHDTGNFLYSRLSASPENIDRFGDVTRVRISQSGSAPVSYAQLVEYDGYVYCFFRYNTSGGWYYIQSNDRGATWSTHAPVVKSNNQYYIKFAKTTQDGLLRLSMYANPELREGIRFGYLDLATWKFYKMDGTTEITQAADGSVNKTDFGDPVIGVPTNRWLRLFDVAVTAKGTWRVLIADMDNESGNAVEYYLWNGESKVQICTSDLKLWSKYPNGVCFLPDGRIASIRADNGEDIVEIYATDGSTVTLQEELARIAHGSITVDGTAQPQFRLYRPIPDINGRVLTWLSGFYNKANFNDFNMELVIHRFDDKPATSSDRIDAIDSVMPKGFHTTWTNQSYSSGAILDDTQNRLLSGLLKLKAEDTYTASGDARFRLVFYKNGVLQTATSGGFVSSYTVPSYIAATYDGMRINVKQSADANITPVYGKTHIFHTGSNEDYVSVDDYDPTVPVLGTEAVITAEPGKCYQCGTLASLSFTPCSKGICEVIFTSGSTPTTLTLPDTAKMPDWWTGTEANRVYDIMILNGTYGVVTSWAT